MMIVLGVVAALLLVCCIGGVVAFNMGGQFIAGAVVESPEEAAQLGHEILDYTLPAGYQESGAINLFGNTFVIIQSQTSPQGMVFMLGRFNPDLAGNEQQMQQQLRESLAQQSDTSTNEVAQVSSEDITVNGETTTMTIYEGTSEQGEQIRQVIVPFGTGEGPGMLLIMAPLDEWDQEAVDAFLNSVR
jgi:hypothetical protein